MPQPQQEIALRRIANGSFVVDAQAASTLVPLALIQQTSSGLRLTPLGRLNFNALPKAQLLGQQRLIHAVTGYVEGLIEKAQTRMTNEDARAKTSPQLPPARPPAPPGLLLEMQDGEGDFEELPVNQPIYFSSTASIGRHARNVI